VTRVILVKLYTKHDMSRQAKTTVNGDIVN